MTRVVTHRAQQEFAFDEWRDRSPPLPGVDDETSGSLFIMELGVEHRMRDQATQAAFAHLASAVRQNNAFRDQYIEVQCVYLPAPGPALPSPNLTLTGHRSAQ